MRGVLTGQVQHWNKPKRPSNHRPRGPNVPTKERPRLPQCLERIAPDLGSSKLFAETEHDGVAAEIRVSVGTVPGLQAEVRWQRCNDTVK